eukprot:scaffold7225_cov379-Prasinococcus_capsulatus_cf.AAC.17
MARVERAIRADGLLTEDGVSSLLRRTDGGDAVDELIVRLKVQLAIAVDIQVKGQVAGRLVAAHQLVAQVVVVLKVQGGNQEPVIGHREAGQRDSLLEHAVGVASVTNDEDGKAAQGGARGTKQLQVLVEVCAETWVEYSQMSGWTLCVSDGVRGGPGRVPELG